MTRDNLSPLVSFFRLHQTGQGSGFGNVHAPAHKGLEGTSTARKVRSEQAIEGQRYRRLELGGKLFLDELRQRCDRRVHETAKAFTLSGPFTLGNDAQRNTASGVDFAAGKVGLVYQRRSWRRADTTCIPIALWPRL